MHFLCRCLVHIHANSMSAKTIIKISLCFNQSSRWMVEKASNIRAAGARVGKDFSSFQNLKIQQAQ